MARQRRTKAQSPETGSGSNAIPAEESKEIQELFADLKDQKLKRDAFSAKMRERRAAVAGRFKALGFKMSHVDVEFENYMLGQSDDKDAAKKMSDDQALRLDTARRIHAALSGEQLNFVDMQERAEQARKDAEADAEADAGKVHEQAEEQL